MGASYTDKYWNRSVATIGLLFILTVVLLFAVAITPINGPTFNSHPILMSIGVLFSFFLFIWPIPFGYFVSQDKRELSKSFSDINTRHWLTTILFSYISGGIYSIWYITYRKYKIDISNHDDSTSTHQTDSSASGRINEVDKPETDSDETHTNDANVDRSSRAQELAANAYGDSVTASKLKNTGVNILLRGYLHDAPMMNYLNEEEQPHFIFRNGGKCQIQTPTGTEGGGWPNFYYNFILITDKGVHFFAGQSSGDFHQFVPFSLITGFKIPVIKRSQRFELILAIPKGEYLFYINGLLTWFSVGTEEVKQAKSYIRDQIQSQESLPDNITKTENQSDSNNAKQASVPKQDSGNQDTDESHQTDSDNSSPSTDDEDMKKSEIKITMEELIKEGKNLQSQVTNQLSCGSYERALRTNSEAVRVYEDALEIVKEADNINSDDIKQQINAAQAQRETIHRQQLQSEIETLRSDLRQSLELADDDELETTKEHLTALQSALTSAKETATKHGFDDLHNELKTIERQCNKRVDAITDRLSMSIPDTIPTAPSVSVDYDTLSDEEPIGGGGNADVSKAIHSTAEPSVTLAIKEPRMSGTLHREQVDRMLEEAEMWDRLDDHNHIVGVVDYDSDPYPWIAMEHMDGGHLGERTGEMPLPQAVWTALTVTRGVRHAHNRGVAHLDLKPANVLFRTVEDGWDVPKVADWGLSKHLLDHSNSVEGLSPQYAAPEQFDDEYGPTDDTTDIYQLGAVFYELFTGHPPFDGKPFEIIGKVKDESPTPPSEIADVPNKLDDILLTALAKQKDDRYEDILYLRDDLKEVLGSVTGDIDGGDDRDDEDDDDEYGEDELPVNRDVHEDLVSVVETAPNRAWINEYFDWLATLLEETDLDKHDDRLVTSIRTEQKSLPVTISWRYCLKGFPSEEKVAAILPHDSAAIDELAAAATYTQRFEGNSGPDPHYYQLPASAGDFFIEEFEDDWLRAVQNQCDVDRNARNPGAHEPAVCIAALDSDYRRRVLNDAF